MKTLFVALAVLSVGCGVSNGEVDMGEDLADDSFDLSSTKDTFLTARRDLRRCISPLCGGYWVKDLNSTMQERYVSAFEFDESLPASVRDQVSGAPDYELVLEGRLGPKENRFKTRPLKVIAAYRGMPGKTFKESDKFYSVFPTKIGCATQPCAYLSTTRLNRTTGHTMATDVSVDRALGTLVDGQWLHGRVMSGRAVVAGRIVRANKHITVDASQVFVALPDRTTGCVKAPIASCPAGKIRGFERNEDRCNVQAGCVEPRFCAAYVPTCDVGYSLVSWRSSCTAYACDPDFLF